MKVLSGAVARCRRDAAGRRPCSQPAHPLGARRRGVAMIYQELSLAPHLTVEENIMLGLEPTRSDGSARAEPRPGALQALEQLGHADPPRTSRWAALPSPHSSSSRSPAPSPSAAACSCSTSRPAASPRRTSSGSSSSSPAARPGSRHRLHLPLPGGGASVSRTGSPCCATGRPWAAAGSPPDLTIAEIVRLMVGRRSAALSVVRADAGRDRAPGERIWRARRNSAM